MRVGGKIVVVTGGGHGIGEGLAERFVAEGAKAVVVSDLDPALTASVGERLGQPRRPCDVSDAAALTSLLSWVEDEIGPIDLMCNNPAFMGGLGPGPEALASEETWQRSWDIGVMAHVHAADFLVPRMLARGGGWFLQTLSAAALITANAPVAYSVTKHAALGFAEWLVINYGDRGIRVSCLCPAAVETRGTHLAGIGNVLTPVEVAEAVIAGLEAEQFLILPNGAVGGSFRKKATDYDAWLERTIERIAPIKLPGPWDDRFPPHRPAATA